MSAAAKPHVCHITTVHAANDHRIFNKQCVSLAANGFRVTLLAANTPSKTEGNVEIQGVPISFKGRWQRTLKVPSTLYRQALAVPADVYHFHDPDFLLMGERLKRRGARVIYDAHEDRPLEAKTKHYIPELLKGSVASAIDFFETRCTRKFDGVVTATESIRDRFQRTNRNTIDVRNFPSLTEFTPALDWQRKERAICYFGGLTRDRGLWELCQAIEGLDCVLYLAGVYSPPEFREQLSNLPGWKNVRDLGFLPRQKVAEIMRGCRAGIVTLHPQLNYLDSLPVKMFEYMASGIPVIASDFPLWREIVMANRCGDCVSPTSVEQLRSAIERCLDGCDAEEMGNNGRRAIEQHYNWESESRKLIQFYQRML